jgi:hypothetical protein
MGPRALCQALASSRSKASWRRSLAWLAASTWMLCLQQACPALGAPCPNESFRTGPSAELPDCRAYELVSRSDTNGIPLTNIQPWSNGDTFPIEHLSPSGESVVFETVLNPLRSPLGATGMEDSWEAVRTEGGWQTIRRLSPSGAETPDLPTLGGVSSDHAYEFFFIGRSGGTPPEAGGTLGLDGPTDYLSNPDGSFEVTGVGSLGEEPLAQGQYIGPGGAHVVFTTGGEWCRLAGPSDCARKQLEPNAPPSGTEAVYDRGADGPTHVISLLPGNVTPAAGEDANYQGVSLNGSVIAFKIGDALYVRVDNAKTEEVTSSPSTFGGLSSDGGALFYVAGGNIFRYETTSEAEEQINASGDADLVNVSADGSHVYFVSTSQLDGGKGTSGQPNLYVWNSDTSVIRYIATVEQIDLEGVPALDNWTSYAVSAFEGDARGPGGASSRSTPDGHVLAFESAAQLTDYSNDGHTEIYRYDDRDESLICVSCNSLQAPAVADARLQAYKELSGDHGAASTVVHNLSEDGNRVFFETEEALVGGDVDEVNDIYEWHQDNEASAPVLDLISSGQSMEYPPLQLSGYRAPLNILLGVTPTGDDVVFFSQDALTEDAGVGGALAIYDARVNGGFPSSPLATSCEEEPCRGSVDPAPSILSPSSEQVLENQNVKPKKRCRHRQKTKKGKHRNRCIRKHHRGRTSVSASMGENLAQSLTQEQPENSPSQAGAASDNVSISQISASADEQERFSIEEATAEESTNAAGSHADFTTRLVFNHYLDESGRPAAWARGENISVRLPPGLIGDPTAIPTCSTGAFVAGGNCPVDTQVGIAKVLLAQFGTGKPLTTPVFNLVPPHPDVEVARLGFYAGVAPIFIDVSIRTASDFGVTATVHGAPGAAAVLSATTTLWGNPPDPSHDKQRLTSAEGASGCESACTAPGGKRTSSLPPTAFMTNPTACENQQVDIAATSYQFPGEVFTAIAPMEPIVGCEAVPFEARLELHTGNQVAGAPTGLQATLTMPQRTDVELTATSALRQAKVTLPEGMTISAPAAAGLATCSAAEVHLHEEADAGCPDASKLGTATIVSPNLPQALEGALYARSPEPGHLFRLWLVVDQLGLHIKLPAEISPDPTTGQITVTFDDTPQVPIEEVRLTFWGGARAPLKNPSRCGSYVAHYEFTPWSGTAPVVGAAPLSVDQKCSQGFSPKLQAGTTKPRAGRFSDVVFNLFSGEEEESASSLEVMMPPGLLAKLRGVPLCPSDAAETGACPEGSRLGEAKIAAGTGSSPLWLPAQDKAQFVIYLAGAYGNYPYSLVVDAPVQAGPFDLGTVVARAGIDIDPESGRVIVHSDLPRIVGGVPIAYRTLHILLDRPGFGLNPTNCKPLSSSSTITSVAGDKAHPGDRFQVGGCKSLGFKPRLSLAISGGTDRAKYPALTAKLRARKGDANIARVSVTLPHSEFLAQEHIRTICTKVQIASRKCPKGSIYGFARAKTPLLGEWLKGPVYLRSSSHALPDLVAALRGRIEIDLVGRIDSQNGAIRTVFESVPDAPIHSFELHMKGGSASLLRNSEDVCRGPLRAIISLKSQNGRVRHGSSAMKTPCRGAASKN